MQRLCQILVGAGVLRDDDSGYSWTGATLEEADDAAHLAASFPACGAEITLLERCGSELASVLRDEVDPVALLFAEDSRETLHQLYRETPFAKHMNNALATALDCALGSVPTTRPLRILEVGAGTGGTTQFVLTKLAGRRLSYCFTDVSPSFLSSAEQEFGSDGELTYHLLDIERDPSEQGFTPQSFDIVISANAIHATEDVAASMRHIETLLAPGGAVFLLEGTSREPWVDLTFGLTDGWWRFTDTELRSDYPLLSRGQWCHAFSDVGFDSVSATPSGSDRGGSQALVMGRKPQQEDWYPQPLRGRRWVVVHSDSEVSTELLGALPNAVNLPYDPVQGELDWRSRLSELGSDESGLSTEFIYLCAPVDGDPTATVAASLGFVRAVMRADLQRVRVWLVTSGGVAVGEGGSDVVPNQAPAWGLGRGLSLERPDLWGGIVDVDAVSHASEQAWSIIESVCAEGDEDQIAYRSGAQHVARLERFSPVGEERCSYPSDGACLITGGLGGLGMALAERLAQRGVPHLVLIGREGLPPRSNNDPRWAAIDAIEQHGTTVEVAAVDVTDRAALSSLLEDLRARSIALKGIYHTAAAITESNIDAMSDETLRDALSAKIKGTLLLDELTVGEPIEAFVMFSSSTALLGVAGLAHYAAANCFLDAFAHRRRASGRPALAVNWGTWEIMRAASDAEREQFALGGLRPMAAERALDALELLLSAGSAQSMVADVDWNRLKSVYESRRARPLLASIGAARIESVVNEGSPQSVVARIRALQPTARLEAIADEVRSVVRAVLKLDESRRLDLGEGFFDLGMDSLMAVELKSGLASAFDCSLPSTLTFNYPNIGALTAYLNTELFDEPESMDSDSTSQEVARSTVAEPSNATESDLEQQLADKLRGLGF